MIKKMLLSATCLIALLAATGSVMYVRNSTPGVPVIPVAEIANPTRPYVIKVHAKWCPVCMMTKSIWSQIDSMYSGRVNLVVLDLTNEGTIEKSRIEAKRLGLEKFFEEGTGATGVIAVLDGRTKEVRASIQG